MDKDEALKLALEALDNLLYWDNGKSDYDQAREAITAIKQALAAPVQPMAHIVGEIDHTGKVWKPVQPAPVQPMAWRFTGVAGFKRFVTDAQHKAFSPEVQAWYEPFRCSSCTTPPAQPAVPDAMTSADIQEHIEYVAGWNDCRQAMLEMMK